MNISCDNCKRKGEPSYSTFFIGDTLTTLCGDCKSGINLPMRRKPLTDRERRKLEWGRNENKWLDDIRSRRVLPNGKVGVFDNKGNLKEVRD